jgi:hypothetical protein
VFSILDTLFRLDGQCFHFVTHFDLWCALKLVTDVVFHLEKGFFVSALVTVERWVNQGVLKEFRGLGEDASLDTPIYHLAIRR